MTPSPVRYQPVPTMELMPVRPPECRPSSCSNSETSNSCGDRVPGRSMHDRRRARLNSELLNAVLEGNHEEVAKKLESGASVDATCRRSRTTALQLAVACGHPEIVQLLLCRGAVVRLADRAGRQAVHIAAAVGNLLLLQLILDSDPSVLNNRVSVEAKPEDSGGGYQILDSWSHRHETVAAMIPDLQNLATPLFLAAQRLHLDCVTELLTRNARVDQTDNRGLTPLDVVGEISPPPSTDVLLELADALPSSEDTLTRIENLRQRISRNPTMRSMGMKVTVQNDKKLRSKRSPIQIALPNADKHRFENPPSSVYLPSSFRRSDPTIVIAPTLPSKTDTPSEAYKIVNELIKKGAKMPASKVILKQGSVQNQVTMPMTCLHTSVELEDVQLVEYLLDNGGCQLAWNKDGLTALHVAVKNHLLESLKTLLEKTKSSEVVNARDIFGRTSLHLAVEEEWFCGVSFLLEAGADVTVTCNDKNTVLHIAAQKTDPQLLEELLTIPESVKIIDSRNNNHESPLHCAVNASQLHCVNLLLSHKADVTACLLGDVTVLHLAAETGSINVLEALLADQHITQQKGFKDIRSKEGKGGTTALHIAALGGFVDCVKALIDADCNVFAITTDLPHYGSTALHLASINGHHKVVESIVSHDKNTMCMKNGDGWYPLHVAASFGKEDCARYMLLNGSNLAATVFDSGGFKKSALDIIVNSIVHPIHFLESIFDCCIEKNEYPLHSPKCLVKVRYDILQPLGPHRKQMKVLDSLLGCGKEVVQEKLLLHPLVESFLCLKWKKLRVFFFFMMILNMIFTASLTTMAMLFYVVKIESTVVNSCIVVCRIVLCTSLTLMTLQELLQVSRMQRYYFKDMESWVKWSTYILATVIAFGNHPAPWLVHVSAVGVLLSWLEMLFLLSRWPSSLGFYILMFFTVAKNVLRVFATFTFVILGFMFAFMIHFQASGPFENWWEALVKVLVMTLEFDYQNLYENIQGVSATSVVGRIIFLSFMILVAVVLMNLLVGLAVSDITTLEKQGRAQRLAKQIEFLSLLEMFVYNQRLFTCCPSKLFVALKRFRATEPNLLLEPGKPLRHTQYLVTRQLLDSVINNLVNRKNRIGCGFDEDEEKEHNSLSESPNQGDMKSTKVEEKLDQNTLNAQTKETLDMILSEIVLIKQQIENIKKDQ